MSCLSWQLNLILATEISTLWHHFSIVCMCNMYVLCCYCYIRVYIYVVHDIIIHIFWLLLGVLCAKLMCCFSTFAYVEDHGVVNIDSRCKSILGENWRFVNIYGKQDRDLGQFCIKY